MATLNNPLVQAFTQRKIKASTDVTGFGLLGHAHYLAQAQKESVRFVIDTLPVIRGCKDMEGKVRDFGLFRGTSAETSGGLLCAVEEKHVEEVLRLSGGYLVGRVESAERREARIEDGFRVLEVE